MAKRTDLKSILIIGAGPIVIGQACEFDYSGAQACKALRQEGYKVILVNSNPATIMTDPEMADVTYIEPITWQMVEKIIAKEKPDAILPTMGGQTALNCALDLHKHGVLAKHGVEMIGANEKAIEKAEDRLKFKDAMTSIGLDSAKSGIAHTMEQAWAVQKRITAQVGGDGFPVVIRPSFTLGGTGGGIAYNPEEFEEICKRGIDLSPTHELLIEESLKATKHMFGMDYVIFRPHNIYGERQNLGDPYRNVVGIFMNLAMQGKALWYVGPGRAAQTSPRHVAARAARDCRAHRGHGSFHWRRGHQRSGRPVCRRGKRPGRQHAGGNGPVGVRPGAGRGAHAAS
jgi:hypothetical protein